MLPQKMNENSPTPVSPSGMTQFNEDRRILFVSDMLFDKESRRVSEILERHVLAEWREKVRVERFSLSR